MELSGEEKKLQALFSEVKAADEQMVPRFATVWNRAQLRPRRIRAFNPAFVAVTALLFCALISLAVWSRYSQRAPQIVGNAPTTPVPLKTSVPSRSLEVTPIANQVKPREMTPASRGEKLAARRRAQLLAANRKLTQDAKTISNWQSPTSALLSSPSDGLFSSLPQLNQSATELKSFLPNRPN